MNLIDHSAAPPFTLHEENPGRRDKPDTPLCIPFRNGERNQPSRLLLVIVITLGDRALLGSEISSGRGSPSRARENGSDKRIRLERRPGRRTF